MKKILFAFVILTFVFACNQQNSDDQSSFTIEGTIAAYDTGYVYLQKVVDGELTTVDSMICSQGKFSFKGTTDFAELYYLSFGDRQHMASIFMENSDIVVKGNLDSLDNISITGSKAQDEYKLYKDEMLPFDNKMNDLYKQYTDAEKEGNKALMDQIDSSYETLYEDKLAFIKNYIGTHNASVIIPYVLNRELAYSLEVNELDSMVNLLDSSLNPSIYVNTLKEKVATLKNVEVGKQAPDFTLNDTTGNPVTMSSFKGKYLLIDFWAAWCGPCRRENPNNVKLYADYKDKGFEILGVSFDKKREAWVKAINDDGLTWPQVSDLKYWKSEAGKLYGVSAIPHTVLLDKDGIIIAKNLRGDELRTKVSELIDK
ncbi:MAG: TlpA disulfide reductase family protein [Bacteroidales bacterium]|nr:TlpA disulfide reductase family protein [Bacteroidales bacterium]